MYGRPMTWGEKEGGREGEREREGGGRERKGEGEREGGRLREKVGGRVRKEEELEGHKSAWREKWN